MMLDVNKENFEQEVKNASGLVLVDFWSESCEPCKALMPEVEKLAEKYAGKIKFTKLNIQGNRRLAMAEKVMGLPAFNMYKDGEKIWNLSDDVTIENLEDKIASTLA